MYCGTKSGRDVDKFADLGLATAAARTVASPVIDIPGTHFECRTIVKTPMDPALVAEALMPLYPEKDWHTLYFGEIVACYER